MNTTRTKYQRVIIALIGFSMIGCGSISSIVDIYGEWTPETTECKKDDIALNYQAGNWKFTNRDAEYGVAELSLPDAQGKKQISSEFTGKYDKDIDQVELIFSTQELGSDNRMNIYKLSSSKMEIGFHLNDGTFCKVKFKKG